MNCLFVSDYIPPFRRALTTVLSSVIILLTLSALPATAVESLVALGSVDEDGTLLNHQLLPEGMLTCEREQEGQYKITIQSDEINRLLGAYTISATPKDNLLGDTIAMGLNSSSGLGGLAFTIFTREAETAASPDSSVAADQAFYFVIRQLPTRTQTLDRDTPFLAAIGETNTGSNSVNAFGVNGIVVEGQNLNGGVQALTLTKPGAFTNDTVDNFVFEATIRNEFVNDETVRGIVSTVTDNAVTILVSTDDVQDDANSELPTTTARDYSFAVYHISDSERNRPAASKLLLSSLTASSNGSVSSDYSAHVDANFAINAARTSTGRYVIFYTRTGFFQGRTEDQFLPLAFVQGFPSDSVLSYDKSITSDHTLRLEIQVQDVEVTGDGFGERSNQDFSVNLFDLAPTFQPDTRVGKRRNLFSMRGNNIYNGSGAGQTQRVRVKGKKSARVYFAVENDSQSTDTSALRGIARRRFIKQKHFQLTGGRTNVTGALRIGVLRTPALRPGQAYLLESQIKAKRKSQSRRIRPQRLTFISTSTETAATDVATARIVVKP